MSRGRRDGWPTAQVTIRAMIGARPGLRAAPPTSMPPPSGWPARSRRTPIAHTVWDWRSRCRASESHLSSRRCACSS